MFGAPQNEKFNNCYSYTKVYAWDQKTTEYRKYKGSDFSTFVYHKNINGGYPFPKSLFAVGHFIDSDILAYFKDYSFTPFNYNFVYEDGLYTMELGRFPQTLVSDSIAQSLREFLNDSFYNTIFSVKEKSIIQTTRYSSSDEYYTSSQSANTSDNIFLPLRKKIEEGYYQLLPFGLPTDFALVNNLFCGYVNREVQTFYRLGNLMRINNQWATSCILAGGDAPENEVELLTYNGIGISHAITLK